MNTVTRIDRARLKKTIVLFALLAVWGHDAHASAVKDGCTFTNHAGHVVSGAFGGVTNGTFIVGGKAYPLSILPKGEQLRVRKLAGCDVRTAKQKRLDKARALRLERIRLREAEGEIDRETAERLRREALGGVGDAGRRN